MDEIQSSQVTEGQVSTTETPQAVPTSEQSGSEAQPITQTQVEGQVQSASQTETKRASDYETARQLKRLARDMQSLKKALDKGTQSPPPSSPATQRVAITNEEFAKDPIGAMQRLLEARDQQLMSQIPQTLQQRDQAMTFERSRQAALRTIETNESVKKDPEGRDRMLDILLEEDENGNSLDKYSQTNPSHAAKIALDTYNARYATKKVQGVPSKAQMVSTATATQPGGQKVNTQQEAAQLQKEVLNNPSLLQDPAFRARLTAMVNKSKQESAEAIS